MCPPVSGTSDATSSAPSSQPDQTNETNQSNNSSESNQTDPSTQSNPPTPPNQPPQPDGSSSPGAAGEMEKESPPPPPSISTQSQLQALEDKVPANPSGPGAANSGLASLDHSATPPLAAPQTRSVAATSRHPLIAHHHTNTNAAIHPNAPAVAVAPHPPATHHNTNTNAADPPILPNATTEEFEDLNNWYDHGDASARRDQANAFKATEYGDLASRGYPGYARAYEHDMPRLQASLAVLPENERNQYIGVLNVMNTAYNNASNPEDRKTIYGQFAKVRNAIYAENARVLSDPLLHTESLFNRPYGYGFLSAEEQKEVDRLEDYRLDFENARTAEEREEILADITNLRAQWQDKIGQNIDAARDDSEKKWNRAVADVYQAQKDSDGMTVYSAAELQGSQRALYFAQKVFNDPLRARAFTDEYMRHPENFAKLKSWEDDFASRDKLATWSETTRVQPGQLPPPPELFAGILGNLLPPNLTYNGNPGANSQYAQKLAAGSGTTPMPPGPVLPPFVRFTDIPGNLPLPNAHYDENLGANYEYAQKRMVAGERRLSAGTNGPLRNEYVNAYSAPKPVWQQELDEGLCRFFTGMAPGVNLINGYICPRSPLDDTSRTFIDIGGNVAGGMLMTAFGDKGGGFFSHMDPIGLAKGGAGALLQNLYSRIPGKSSAMGPAIHVEPPKPLPASLGPELGEAHQRIEGASPLMQDYARAHPLPDQGDSGTPGVGKDANGQQFVTMNGQQFAVMKDGDAWRAYDPNNLARPSFRVQQDASGNWQVHDNELNPKGGGLPGGAPRLTQEKRQEIEQFIRDNPNVTYKDIADHFEVSDETVSKISRAAGLRLSRPRATITPAQRAAVENNLRAGMSRKEAGRAAGVSTTEATRIAQNANIESPNSGRHTDEATKRAVLADLDADPAQLRQEIADRHGVSTNAVLQWSKEAGLNKWNPHSYTRVSAEERLEIQQYAQAHPEASPQALGDHFGRSRNAIRRALEASGQRVAPSAAYGSAEQRLMAKALDAHPDASDAEIAQQTGTTPEAVRDYAELHHLTRGGLDPANDVPPDPPDLPMPSAEEVDNMIDYYAGLNPSQQAIVNEKGNQYSAELIGYSLGKSPEVIRQYERSDDYHPAPFTPTSAPGSPTSATSTPPWSGWAAMTSPEGGYMSPPDWQFSPPPSEPSPPPSPGAASSSGGAATSGAVPEGDPLNVGQAEFINQNWNAGPALLADYLHIPVSRVEAFMQSSAFKPVA